jgi:hypothetical protein
MDSHEGPVFLPSRDADPLRNDWQKHGLASHGYFELGMFDDAALVLEEIAPEDKNRNEVLGAPRQPLHGGAFGRRSFASSMRPVTLV